MACPGTNFSIYARCVSVTAPACTSHQLGDQINEFGLFQLLKLLVVWYKNTKPSRHLVSRNACEVRRLPILEDINVSCYDFVDDDPAETILRLPEVCLLALCTWSYNDTSIIPVESWSYSCSTNALNSSSFMGFNNNGIKYPNWKMINHIPLLESKHSQKPRGSQSRLWALVFTV